MSWSGAYLDALERRDATDQKHKDLVEFFTHLADGYAELEANFELDLSKTTVPVMLQLEDDAATDGSASGSKKSGSSGAMLSRSTITKTALTTAARMSSYFSNAAGFALPAESAAGKGKADDQTGSSTKKTDSLTKLMVNGRHSRVIKLMRASLSKANAIRARHEAEIERYKTELEGAKKLHEPCAADLQKATDSNSRLHTRISEMAEEGELAKELIRDVQAQLSALQFTTQRQASRGQDRRRPKRGTE